MTLPQITPARINRRNRTFWNKQGKLLTKRIADKEILEAAIADLRRETNLPIKERKSFEALLELAEELVRRGRTVWGNRTFEAQSVFAKLPRKQLADGTHLHALINAVLLAWDLPRKPQTKLLWPKFLDALKAHETEPREAKTYFACTYRAKHGRTTITFRTFSNIVAKIRARDNSR